MHECPVSEKQISVMATLKGIAPRKQREEKRVYEYASGYGWHSKAISKILFWEILKSKGSRVKLVRHDRVRDMPWLQKMEKKVTLGRRLIVFTRWDRACSLTRNPRKQQHNTIVTQVGGEGHSSDVSQAGHDEGYMEHGR